MGRSRDGFPWRKWNSHVKHQLTVNKRRIVKVVWEEQGTPKRRPREETHVVFAMQQGTRHAPAPTSSWKRTVNAPTHFLNSLSWKGKLKHTWIAWQKERVPNIWTISPIGSENGRQHNDWGRVVLFVSAWLIVSAKVQCKNKSIYFVRGVCILLLTI